MPEATDTTKTEGSVETEASQVNGTEVDESTGTEASEISEPVEQPKTEAATAEETEAEKLRKENNKLQMELNQRRNETKAAEEARKAAELKALEDEGKWQDIAEKLKADAEARAQEEQQREAEAFRSKIIDEYGSEVAEKARKLNLYWDEAPDFPTAEAQLRAKLEVLKGEAPTSTAKDDTQIHPNNPSSIDMGIKDFDSLPLDKQIEELRKQLGRAPQR